MAATSLSGKAISCAACQLQTIADTNLRKGSKFPKLSMPYCSNPLFEFG
jgi:hypothetical protein